METGDKRLLEIGGLRIEAVAGDAVSEIVKGIDLNLNRGEVLGLIGESGAGKSTIGLAAMGFSRAGTRISGGRIVFDGQDLRAASAAQLRALRGARIAYVAQSAAASFNPAHTIIDQHVEAPVLHGFQSRAAAQDDGIKLYAKLRLPEPDVIGFRYPHQLSGGQLQRAMTAMAMACRPDLIIFDEPTTALDVTTQVEVLSAIRDAVEQFHTAAIYITHDLAVVAQMADRIKVLLKGEEVEEAPTKQMLAHPKENYTKKLWAVRSYERPEKSRASDTTQPELSIRGLEAGYRHGPKVLHDVNFDLHRGMTVAVVGESGSGKSTTARVIMGLLPAASGEIRMRGEALPGDFRARSKDQLRRIQMIYQSAETALNPRMRVSEIIGRPAQFYADLKGRALRSRVEELLSLIELEPAKFYDRFPLELSGGQKQRVGIARALAADPDIVICDEVTSALDQLVAEGILRLLDRLQSEIGLTYMFVTHDLATVRAIADEVVVMQRGCVVDSGRKSEIFAPPYHPYTAQLLASEPQMDPNWLDVHKRIRGLEDTNACPPAL
jgi:peptide/nickel transport system ATP-binding protein